MLSEIIQQQKVPAEAANGKAVAMLVQAISASPGLSKALGLGADPAQSLQKIVAGQ